MVESRLRTWISFIAISSALQAAVENGSLLSFQIKGGAALELRFPGIARATRDLDIGLPGTRAERLSGFSEALSLGFDRFTFRVKPTAYHMEAVNTVRVSVVVAYESRGFQTIDVDLGPDDSASDGVTPRMPVIESLAVPLPSLLPCLTMPFQIAQKLHAVTNPRIVADPKQDRAKDLIDVIMLTDLGQNDENAVLSAAQQVFQVRNEHTWPPIVPQYPVAWRATMQRLAEEIQYPHRAADLIVARFSDILASIVEGNMKVEYEYRFLSLAASDGGQTPVVTDNAAHAELKSLAKDGWRLHSIFPNGRNSGMLIATLERRSELPG